MAYANCCRLMYPISTRHSPIFFEDSLICLYLARIICSNDMNLWVIIISPSNFLFFLVAMLFKNYN